MAMSVLSLPTSQDPGLVTCSSISPKTEENMVLLSKITKRTSIQKGSKFRSTANKVYKASSDHFDQMYTKTNKKSVLTLPNEPAIMPQECTVSDVNDTDYLKKGDDQGSWRQKCRLPVRYNKNTKQRIVKRDGQVLLRKNSDSKGDDKTVLCKSGAHDVWAILRNMNRFQYQPSPPMSDSSFELVKKKKNRKTRIFETCHTEEIEYTITSYDLDTKNPHRTTLSEGNDIVGTINVHQHHKTEKNNTNKLDKAVFKNNKIQVVQSIPKENNKVHAKKCVSLTQYNLNKDQGDVIVNRNLSIETLKDNDYTSNSTLTQSLGTSIGTATSSKYYADVNMSKVIKPRLKTDYKLRLNQRPNKRNQVTQNDKLCDVSKNIENSSVVASHKSNSLVCSPSKKARTYKVINNLNNKDIPMKPLPLTQVQGAERNILKVNKNICNDSIEKIFDYRGKFHKTSSDDLNKQNSLQCSEKVNIKEIKKSIANIRFPVVITGRDQIRPIRVQNCVYSQFAGLDSRIWPYMIDWVEPKKVKTIGCKNKTWANNALQVVEKDDKRYEKKKELVSQVKKTGHAMMKLQEQQKVKGQIIPKIENSIDNRKRKFEQIELTDEKPSSDCPKSLNFHQLKDKVRKLLHKKSSSTIGNSHNYEQVDLNNYSELEFQRPMTKIVIKNKRNQNVINVGFGNNENNVVLPNLKTNNCQTNLSNELSTDHLHNNTKPIDSKLHKNKRIWTKAKWANDVIDNVLKKMKNGFYYMQQIQPPNSTYRRDKEIIQDEDEDSDMESEGKDKVIINNIPGFDAPLPALEVETLSMNEIAIKQCVTNLTIRFDVIVPNSKPQNNEKSSEVIPTEIPATPPGILKCQTTILNTILPAELCSVIPKMMRKFSETNLKAPSPSVKATKTEQHLATITELNRIESGMLSVMPILGMSENFQNIFSNTGSFNSVSSLINKTPYRIENGNNIGDNCALTDVYIIIKDFPKSTMKLSCNVEIPFMIHLNFQQQSYPQLLGEKNVSNELSSKNCTNNNLIVSRVWKFDLIDLLKTIAVYCEPLTTRIELTHNSAQIMNMALKINNDICTNFLIRTPRLSNSAISLLSCLKSDCLTQSLTSKDYTSVETINEQYYSLHKITKLEDFFGILGSGPTLSSVFDDKAGEKIMSCVKKMRKWVAQIDAKQAMLLILLTNKCDAQDLVKFGPKLLKAIAVRNITNTSQLQVEIDAIKQNKFDEEKNAALYKNDENGDLFQELYWIAKTAAQHSHGTFDKNAEENLRVFLERRKQFNPSFLRAMATYLGLGMLTIDLEERKHHV